MDLLASTLRCIVRNDKQHKFSSVILPFCENYFFLLTGTWPFMKDESMKKQLQLSPMPFTANQTTTIYKIISNYCKSLDDHTNKSFIIMEYLNISFQQQTLAKDKAGTSSQQSFRQAMDDYKRLCNYDTQLRVWLGLPPIQLSSEDERDTDASTELSDAEKPPPELKNFKGKLTLKKAKRVIERSVCHRICNLDPVICCSIIGGFIAIVTLFVTIALLYHSFSGRMDVFESSIEKKINDKFESLNSTLDLKFNGMEQKFDKKITDLEQKMDKKFLDVDKEFNEINSRLDKMDTRLDKMDNRLDNLNNTIMSIKGPSPPSIPPPFILVPAQPNLVPILQPPPV
ncbi:unnamed protein product [Meloidogyne enterolobii]|uniref:Uncharacterized protein n=1 Tax=Meloidogyne enterolobii TaxID=390850 RepID=A0ACB1AX87_MELEN